MMLAMFVFACMAAAQKAPPSVPPAAQGPPPQLADRHDDAVDPAADIDTRIIGNVTVPTEAEGALYLWPRGRFH
jgi:hypothetical protein